MTSLSFSGKEFVYNHHLSVAYSELKPDLAKSLAQKGEQAGLDGNLIVHGDNLRALKALLPRYEGRVNCIYIDPPYNTGNEGWCYNDNVNMPYLTEWLSNNPVNQEDMQRHEKWCCMMWPRLTLLKQLLAEDGVIFVSIDDNEVHHLRMMMDEIFGENCYRNTIVVKRGVKSVQAQFNTIESLAIGHEYVHFYTKNAETRIKNFMVDLKESKNGGWNNHWRGTERPTMRYELFGITPDIGQWRWSKKRSEVAIKNYQDLLKHYDKKEPTQKEIDDWWLERTNNSEKLDLLRLSKNGKPEHYISPNDEKIGSDLWSDLNAGDRVKILKFDNSKSVNLIKRCLEIGNDNGTDNYIVLDSFAGSGTTAHAVLELNKEDGGSRKFILVECEDYADSITAERVRRVIKGVPSAKDLSLKNGLGGGFTYAQLGEAIDFARMLEADNLPPYKEFAALVWNLFSDSVFEEKKCNEKKFLIGEKDNELVFCFYKPDKSFLLSNESCLNTTRMEELVSSYPNKKMVVYAPACFVQNSDLAKNNINFAYLPFALFRLG